jgi:hypothetical protein
MIQGIGSQGSFASNKSRAIDKSSMQVDNSVRIWPASVVRMSQFPNDGPEQNETTTGMRVHMAAGLVQIRHRLESHIK